MDYGNLLSRAWNIVWNNKFMFVLGFLAALGGGGNGGSAGSNFRVGPRGVPSDFSAEVERFFAQFGPLFLGLACLGLLLVVVFWLIRLAAQGGLISAAARIDAGEKVTFGQAFSAGTSKLGRLIGINLLLYGPLLVVGIGAAILFFVTAGAAAFSAIGASGGRGELETVAGTLGVFAICFVCLACLMIPLFILVSVIHPFAQRGAVLQNLGVTASISHAWNIIKENLGDVILLIILFIIIGLLFGIVLALVLVPFAFLAIGPAVIDVILKDAIGPLNVIMIIIGAIIVALIAAAINSILVAFRSTTITLAYQEFVARARGKLA